MTNYIFESGGGMTNTGGSTIICDASGSPLKAVGETGGYSNKTHAKFLVNDTTFIIKCSRYSYGYTISGYNSNSSVNDEDWTLIFKVEDINEVPKQFMAAAKASLEKAKCYHCREAHYFSKI